MIKFKCFFVNVIFLTIIFMTTGCSLHDQTSTIFLIGNHENSNTYKFQFDEILNDIYMKKGQIAIVEIDGNPTTEYDDNGSGSFKGSVPKEIYDKNRNEKFLERDLSPIISETVAFIDALSPDDPEVDTLAAFAEAANIFSTLPPKNIRQIIVYDTGLCTTGGLDFSVANYLEKNTGEIVAELSSNMLIPELNGVSIEWYGCGEVAEPQEKLSNVQKNKLREIWSAILKESGASIEFRNISHDKNDAPQEHKQKVSVVNLGTVNYRTEFFFRGDTSEFTDQEKAETQILELSEKILENTNTKWWIIGCTASESENIGNQEYKNLAKERALAVRDALIHNGINSDVLKVSALGCQNPWYINNIDNNGAQIEKTAAKNRKVVVLPADSDEAKEYYEIFDSGIIE